MSDDGHRKRPAAIDLSGEDAQLLKRFFRDEAYDYLEEITRRLLAARTTELTAAEIDEVLRATHTLKGSAATVGLNDVAQLAHDFEDSCARIRSRALPWTAQVADRLVEAMDRFRVLLDRLGDPAATAREAKACRAVLASLAEPEPLSTSLSPPAHRSAPAPGSLADPIGTGAGRDETGPRATPTPAGRPSTDAGDRDCPRPDDDDDHTSGSVDRERRRQSVDRRRDEVQILRVDPGRIDRLMNSVGELLLDRTRIERRIHHLRGVIRDITATRQELRDRLAALGAVQTRAEIPTAAQDAANIEEQLARQIAHAEQTIAALLEDSSALRRTSQHLQTGLTEVRMMSVRALFQRLAHPVREMARSAGKQIDLRTEGEETEFDKAVADQIVDPLLQILRNSVAHGIEPEEQRRARGKPSVGTIALSARQEGESVRLDVSDDGEGIDPDALRHRFVASEHWSEERAAAASDAEVLGALFEPGVSTRDKADVLAGRGVGLHAVRQTIARLGGEIGVRSVTGLGTTFEIRLPLTTAISQAFLFELAGQVYAVPNVHVITTLGLSLDTEPKPRRIATAEGIAGVVYLHELLGTAPAPNGDQIPAVLMEYAGQLLAITCDRVVGPREIVVKNLGPLLNPLPYYAGGTISGAGKVQLILDPAALARTISPAQVSTGLAGEEVSLQPDMSTDCGCRLLIADDSKTTREALSRMLASAGYVVDTAVDGRHALRMIGESRYDALITDIEMPHMDGFALIDALTDEPSKQPARLPIIVISTDSSSDRRARARELGARAFLSKPISRAQLLAALEGLGQIADAAPAAKAEPAQEPDRDS